MVESRVKLRGPLFEGDHGRAAAYELVANCSRRVSLSVLEAVQRNLNASIRNPTPYYETQVWIQQISFVENSINDREIIYGPWLEGIGSRNATSRFKGYASFRRATEEVGRKVNALCGVEIKAFLNRMGGKSS